MEPTIIFIAVLLLAAFCLAAWPLLLTRTLRRTVLCTSGSMCVAAGIAMFGLLAATAVDLPGTLARADDTPDEAKATDESANDVATEAKVEPIELKEEKPAKVESSSAPGIGSADATPAKTAAPQSESPQTEPTTSDDPVIETPPQATPIIPPGRPAWVESAPVTTGEVHTIAVCSEPFARTSDALKALDQQLVEKTNEYIADHLGNSMAATFIRYDAKTIRERFVKPENTYHEVITVSIGPMHQSHALVEFRPEFRQEIEQSWDKVRATSRLTQITLFSGAAILLIASVFGYFRVDHATRGYYTGRLQFMTAAAILAVIGGGIFAARWIHWL